VSKNNLSNDSNTGGTVDRVLHILNNEGRLEKSAFEDDNSRLIGKDADLLKKGRRNIVILKNNGYGERYG